MSNSEDTIFSLLALRDKVVAGLWRNHVVHRFSYDEQGNFFEYAPKSEGGCLIQLCCRIVHGYAAQEALTTTLHARSTEWAAIIDWNDQPTRTDEEVLDLIDETLFSELMP